MPASRLLHHAATHLDPSSLRSSSAPSHSLLCSQMTCARGTASTTNIEESARER